ncbi:hypothetical protein J4401_02675 [Candidatus Woesearchaeota archaeon]|nr:hypothetical protein [Candidatus Woesearchaeota archaeon]
MKKKISITIEGSILKEVDLIVDHISIRNRSQAIEHLLGIAVGENRTAVIMAGGHEENIRIGNRYRPTVKIGQKSVVELAIEKLRESGFKSIYIIARQNVLTQIFNIIKDGSSFGVKINYVEEKESNGSADSLKAIMGRIESDFLIVYGDILIGNISLEDIWNDHLKHNAVATIMMTTSSKPSEKGTLKAEGNKVLAFTQKPKDSDIYLVFSPVMAASKELLEYHGASLEKDIFPILAGRGLLNGYLSSEKETHIHSLNDAKKAEKMLG